MGFRSLFLKEGVREQMLNGGPKGGESDLNPLGGAPLFKKREAWWKPPSWYRGGEENATAKKGGGGRD